jgi:tetratricopeptide (TPR) repeat protein
MIALKLPIGLSVLVLIGLLLFFMRRLPPEHYAGLAIILAALFLYLLILALGSTYAGIRHALPVVVLLAILGGFAIQIGFASNSMLLKATVATALVFAAASALPVTRPWEYFNEIIGGGKNAYRYFGDEGVDLGQRGKELAEYYHRVLEPSGEVPILFYGPIGEPEKKARHLDWLGRDEQRDEARLRSPIFSGTVLIDARFLGKKPFWDSPSLRDAAPSARFGNLLVFRGTCACGAVLAPGSYEDAISKIYAKKPDLEAGERLLRQSISLDPSAFFAFIELGNVCVKRGSRENALHAYSDALQHAPNDPELRRSIEEQIKRLSSEPLDRVPELRNPFLE